MTDRARLEAILADVAAMQDRGEDVDAAALLAANPELGDSLRAALAALDLLDLSLIGEAATADRVPELVGPYRVLSRAGAGGMGTVYLAETTSAVAGCEPGERVALKVVHPHLLERPGFFKRFLREAEAGRAVVHPHVVRTLDADAVRAGGDTVHFLVMEYVEGRTLADLLEDLGVVPETLLREIARQMADGLAAIHGSGLIHRDLKPENALITADHVVRLMDLGVARPLAGNQTLTQEGAFAGSLPYAAPEQFGDSEVTAAADLYSLGVTLYELATGQSPFRRDGFAAVMAAHREHVPPAVRDVVPEVSTFFSDVVATLLAKQPDRRFESARDLVAVLTETEKSDWWRERESQRPREAALPQVPVRRETALHGRDADLQALRDAWAAAVDGDGHVVLLEGEAGIGKTRLVDAFLREIGESDIAVLYGSYPPTGGLGGISDAIVEHFGAHGLDAALDPYLPDMPTLVPSIAALLQHRPPPEGAPALTPESLQAALVRLVRALAAEKPLLWVVDDLHFADDESRAVVLSMARAVERHRVLLLGTSRPGLPEDWLEHLGRVEGFERCALGRLGAREVILLLQDAFKSDVLAERLGGKIALKSDGIPFFVFEMIRGLRDGQFLTQLPDGSWAETKVVERIEVPSAVRDLVASRLRGLPREQRAVLDVGAAQGFVFDPDLTARVLGRSRLAVLQDLADLERGPGIVRGERDTCRFDHHQLQEVLYAETPEGLRMEYHAAVAVALATEPRRESSSVGDADGDRSAAICEHALLGGRHGLAHEHLDRALTHLVGNYANERALRLLDGSLAASEMLEGPRRMTALEQRVKLLARGGRPDEERASLDELVQAAEAGGDVPSLANARLLLASHLARASRAAEALDELEACLDLARECGARDIEARGHTLGGQIMFGIGRLADSRDRLESAIALSSECGSPSVERFASQSLGVTLFCLGERVGALALLERGVEAARSTGDRSEEARALANLGNGLLELERYPEARKHFERAAAIQREIGERYGEAMTRLSVGHVTLLEGRYADAQVHLEAQLRLAREVGNERVVAMGTHKLGAVRRMLGDLAAARDLLTDALDRARSLGAQSLQASVLLDLSLLLDDEGDTTRAARRADDALAVGRRTSDHTVVPWILLQLGDLRRREGDRAGAREVFEELLLASRSQKQRSLEMLSLAGLAVVGGVGAGEAESTLEGVARDVALIDAQRLLWEATGDRTHLEAAKRLVDELLSRNPREYHESMCQNVRVNREILAAWREEFGEEGEGHAAADSDDAPDASESATRIVPRE